ncbi:MAG: argininosuccinate lyase [Gammaproteobacteria bacterium]|nr:argininosuccinate lyase [Gammaproteobacteria bacterium]
MPKRKPWGGRFRRPTHALVEAFTESVSFDARLYHYDIQGSLAHARMLARVGLLTDTERDAIVDGLQGIARDIESGTFSWSPELEDVHMNIEAQLTERIGEAGKKLHTGRSRNDQVATDLRLYVRDVIDSVRDEILNLEETLLVIAAREAETILPGFTHLQVAQPVTLGHHLLAWVEMLHRDWARFGDARTRVNVMPLGSAALAGTSLPIDRAHTAELLGFDAPSSNSLDAVSDRDFVIEFVSHCALVMIHLSRIAEELIIWACEPFRFIEIGDAYCTGSSIMPQKKNPDVAELIRGKSGRVAGHLMGLLMLMKGQPLAYNRDNQEDKEPLFDTADTVLDCLRVLRSMLPEVHIHRDHMRAAAARGFATATDLAEYLVGKNVPFRDAHEAVGNAVRYGIEQGKDLAEMSGAELRRFHPEIDDAVTEVLTLEGSVRARGHVGGTAPLAVARAVEAANQRLARSRDERRG